MAAMNMDEWQRKLREEKQKEREQKNQSAAILNNYRGDVSQEDLKLTALRQEERQKQLDAEKLLHSFQNNDMGDIKERPQREELHLAEAPVKATAAGQAAEITRGTSVSQLKDKFGNDTSESGESPGAADAAAAVAAAGATVSATAAAVTGGAEAAKATVEASTTTAAAAVVSTEAAAKEPAVVTPEPLKVDTSTVPAPVEEKTTELPPTIIRLDVLVSFGLLTCADSPSLDGYVSAARQIVQTIPLDNAECDSDFPPYIKEHKWDKSYQDPEGRSDVKRQLIVAGVPIFLPDETTLDQSRQKIVQGLQSAIASGEFVQLALAA